LPAQSAEFGELIHGVVAWRSTQLRRQNQIYGQEAQEALSVLVLALVCELDAPLGVLLEKQDGRFHFIPRQNGPRVASARIAVNCRAG
jgi:hypothetical protein